MDEVGHPERGLRGALVGGTNGKGSVVAMTRLDPRRRRAARRHACRSRTSSATASGSRSTASRSSADDFAAAVERVLPAIDRVAADDRAADRVRGAHRRGHRRARAPARSTSRSSRSGMGGRLDATNVLDLGVAAITNVQLDHEAILGPTLAAIGGEKAPIIKRRQPGGHRRRPAAACDRSSTGAAALGRAAAARRPAPAVSRHGARQTGWDGIVVDARTPARPARRPARSACSARTRPHNAAVALGAARRARRALGHRRSTRRRCGADWRRRAGPGRLELLDGSARRPRTGPARRGAQPGGRARRWPIALERPRRAPPDDRLRRDARRSRCDARAPRPRAARAALRLHAGRRSRRPRPADAGAGLATASPGRPPGRRRPRRRRWRSADGRPGGRRRLALPRRRGPRHARPDTGEEA